VDHTVRRWDPYAEKQQVAVLRGHSAPVLAVGFSPRAETTVSAGADGTVRLWDTLRGVQRYAFDAGMAPVCGVAFSPDRRVLAAAGRDGTVRLWRAAELEAAPEVADAPQ
jgi:WD40 repeat protein